MPAFVLVGSGLIVGVDETYAQIVSKMDGPDLFELHVGGIATTFRAVNVVAVSGDLKGLQVRYQPPIVP